PALCFEQKPVPNHSTDSLRIERYYQIAMFMLQVACAVIMKENRILCAQRSERMRHPLKWEFPGGKVEKDERLDLCIIREVKEELNLDIVVYKLLSKNIHDYGGGNTVCLHPF